MTVLGIHFPLSYLLLLKVLGGIFFESSFDLHSAL